MHDDRLIPIGQAKELEDVGHHADRIHIGRIRIFRIGILLGDHADQLVAGHDFFQQTFALGAADIQRHDRSREDNDVANRQDRQHGWNLQPLTIRAGANDSPIVGSLDNLLFSHF